ncbi:MAG TPA: hydrogenase formation protein HypD [Thermoplasmata archaeon]|jgi:hydrogenase expression/formation protein HypD|nr:hydrogenase formation protein HypD [Thermoplasmata archaeon]HIH29249.1 hydrogenase formation protein HypD [Thermoplasmata archaeon]
MFSLRDKQLADDIISQITKAQVHLRFMHVCGTHQDTLMKHGLDVLLQKCGVEIGQGPGCPVCVTTPKEIEEILLLAKQGKTVATFGDMTRVPGVSSSLQQMKTEGCDVRTVYSIEDALSLAEKHKEKEIVFMAVGFETTAPTTAAVLLQDPPLNFSVLCCHRMIPPALQAILQMGELKIDGFIEPGHVSTIIGTRPYGFISKEYHVPQVIAGFEPLDLLMAVWMLVQQIKQGRAEVENEYVRAVKPQGNRKAQEVLQRVFEPVDIKWRGFPLIPQSGLRLRKNYESYDARKRYEDELQMIAKEEFAEPTGCLCGDVLRGLISSKQCPLFGKGCTPENPIGPCMVSSEGNCHIEYRYTRK